MTGKRGGTNWSALARHNAERLRRAKRDRAINGVPEGEVLIKHHPANQRMIHGLISLRVEQLRGQTGKDLRQEASEAVKAAQEGRESTHDRADDSHKMVVAEQRPAGTVYRLESRVDSWEHEGRHLALHEWRNAARAEKTWWELQTADYQHSHLVAMLKAFPFLFEVFDASKIAEMDAGQRSILAGQLGGVRNEIERCVKALQSTPPPGESDEEAQKHEESEAGA